MLAADGHDELLSIGQRCVVSGLASRAELNGRGGSIVGYDAQSGRHIVKVDGQEGSSSFSLRAANVGAAAAESSLEPSRMAPVTVRRAWRSYLGEFDGDTEDEDEYVADVRAAKRQKAAAPAQRRDVVTLHPRGSRAVTVVATADLHRHHEEEYIGGLSLAGWFESDRSPAHVDVCLFAGDVGLEREAESTSRAQTRRDGERRELLLTQLPADDQSCPS